MEYNVDGRVVLKELFGIEIGEDAIALKDSEGNVRPLMDVIKESQQNKLTDLQLQYKEEKNSQYGRGKKESSTSWEKRLRELGGIDDVSITGEDLVKAITDKRLQEINDLKVSLSNKDLTEEQIKASKFYQDLELKGKTEADELVKVWEEKLANKDIEIAQKENARKMLQVLGGYLTNEKLAYTTDEDVNNVRKNNFIREIMSTPHRFNEDGSVVLLNEDGSLKKDSMQNPIKFTDIVNVGLKNHIGFKDGNVRVPNVPNPKDKDGKKWTGKVPENDQEFMKMMSDPKNADYKNLIAEAYKESKF